MEDINTLVTQNFNDNITYFESSHPELFSKLQAFDSALQNNHYKEKYELVYEQNNFEVIELGSKKTLYEHKADTYASVAAKSVNTDIDNNVFITFHQRKITQEQLDELKQEAPFTNHLEGFAPILYHIQEASKDKKTVAGLEKFIFFGTGLGTHIESIHTKIKSQIYFIIEDDLELFRLSLFTTNYKKLAQDAKLVFSVFDDKDQFADKIHTFLNLEYQYNHYIKYFHMLNHPEDKLSQMHKVLTAQPHLTFFYNDMLTDYTRPLKYLTQKYNFLTQKLSLNDKHLRDKPFLLLAAGPSLQKNKEWLIQNHQNYVIVAVAATLPFLDSVHIAPDILVQLDGKLKAMLHFEKVQNKNLFKESILIFSDKVPQVTLDLFDKNNLFFFENATRNKHNSLFLSAYCVGSVAFEILLRLGVKNIYLLGLDMAIDSKTGLTHSESHVAARKIENTEDSDEQSTLGYLSTLVNIDGNHQEKVTTTQHFLSSIEMINHLLSTIKQSQQKIFNLSDGALFVNTTPAFSSELHIEKSIDKIKIHNHILKLCLQNSSSHLTTKEKSDLFAKNTHAQEMKKLIATHLQQNTKTNEEYINNLVTLSSKLLTNEYITHYELSRIYGAYLKYIIPFIIHFLQNLSTDIQDKEIINKFLLEHLMKITDYYIEGFKEV
jgi:hypothetical protein